MERPARAFRFLLLLAVAWLSLSSCQRQAGEGGERDGVRRSASVAGMKYEIGYAGHGFGSSWMEAYRTTFEYELKNHAGYDVVWFDGESDPSAVAATIGGWISRDVDLIIVSSLDHVPLLKTYQDARTAGIPVLLAGNFPDYRAFDSVSAISGFSEWEAGRMAAELIDSALGGSGRIARITGPRGSASERQATEGFEAALKRLASRVRIAATADGKWDATVAYQKTLDILARFPDLDAIHAADDTTGSAVVRALKEKGYAPGQVKVVSQGGNRTSISDLKEGWYLGIVNQDPALSARQDVWLMHAMLEEHRLPPSIVQVRQQIITKENVDRFPGW